MIDVAKLDCAIGKIITKLEAAEVGSDEHEKALNSLVKIVKLTAEVEQVQQDGIDKEKARDRSMQNDIREYNLKYEQLQHEHRNEVIKHVITIGTTIVTIIVTVWGTKVSLRFEEHGTITTNAGRSFFNGIFNFFRKK